MLWRLLWAMFGLCSSFCSGLRCFELRLGAARNWNSSALCLTATGSIAALSSVNSCELRDLRELCDFCQLCQLRELRGLCDTCKLYVVLGAFVRL